MKRHYIGGEKWRELMRSFAAEYGRNPSKAERKALATLGGFHWPKNKSKGRSSDYLFAKGAREADVFASASVKGYAGKRPDFDDTRKPAKALPAPSKGGRADGHYHKRAVLSLKK